MKKINIKNVGCDKNKQNHNSCPVFTDENGIEWVQEADDGRRGFFIELLKKEKPQLFKIKATN